MSWEWRNTHVFAPALPSPLRKTAPCEHPVHRLGDCAGRSPGLRVIAQLRPAFPVSQWPEWTRARRAQLRGQPRLSAHAGPCSLFRLRCPGEPARRKFGSGVHKKSSGCDRALDCTAAHNRAAFDAQLNFQLGKSMFRTSYKLAGSIAAAAVLTSVTSGSAQLIDRKDLSSAMALAIATGASDACKARGYATSVVVLDRGGNVLVSLRGDGAGLHTVENARRKAYTALTFKLTTKAFIEDMKTRPVRREQTTLPGVIAIDGGVPIKLWQGCHRRSRPVGLARR